MEILFVTTELAPYSVDPRSPEIAEAAASLPKALRGLGHRAVVISPQLLIYYQATGRVIVSSYGSLGFHWTEPRVFSVLSGVTKGLFFWSPLLLLAVPGWL